jgi:3',5'-cyclic AMP phosphodiesterase CpdA
MRTIAHISDLHFGRHDPRKVDGLLKSLAANAPDLVAVSGDLTQRARRREFAQARHFLDSIARPIVVVPGNHDVPLYDVRRRLFKPFAKYHHYITPAGPEDCYFADEEMAALGLNTARPSNWKGGRVSWDQMAHIRRIFGQLPGGIWKVLITHHPVASPHGEARVELAGRSVMALRSIHDAGVHLLLSGHHHRGISGESTAELLCNGGVLVVHAGTAVSERTRGHDGNSYNLIRLEPGRIAVTIMEWRHDAFGEVKDTVYSLAA